VSGVPPPEIAVPPPKVVVTPPGNGRSVTIWGKIIKILAARGQILRHKRAKFNLAGAPPQTPLGRLQRLPRTTGRGPVVRQQLYSTSFFANSGFSFFQVCPPPNEHSSTCSEFLRGIFDTVLTYPKFRYRVP